MFAELPDELKLRITAQLKSGDGLGQVCKNVLCADIAQEISQMNNTLRADSLGFGTAQLSDLQTDVLSRYLLAEAYNPRSFGHVEKNRERSFIYYQSIANKVDTPEVWLRMGQMLWEQERYCDAYYALDAATTGTMKLIADVNPYERAARWLQNRAFLEKAASQEPDDFKATRMLEKYIYRLDGSLHRSETFDEAQIHLRKIRKQNLSESTDALSTFSAIDNLTHNRQEQGKFIRTLESNLAAFEIINISANSITRNKLLSDIVKDTTILSGLSELGLCENHNILLETAKSVIKKESNSSQNESVQEIKPDNRQSYKLH
ncbi:TPA: hypothetical protein MO340_004265 [Salmonella enterica subsp. salamae serovar 35:g,m,s,t:-]|nr:hypothetical protein [Salmonella enterica subsp. salamae serovar 35:g,m,s,t:-]HCA3549735.1 hypothetical protein [Salmonella enterica subsp. salamae serovar 35:g,m,s,t:-]